MAFVSLILFALALKLSYPNERTRHQYNTKANEMGHNTKYLHLMRD